MADRVRTHAATERPKRFGLLSALQQATLLKTLLGRIDGETTLCSGGVRDWALRNV